MDKLDFIITKVLNAQKTHNVWNLQWVIWRMWNKTLGKAIMKNRESDTHPAFLDLAIELASRCLMCGALLTHAHTPEHRGYATQKAACYHYCDQSLVFVQCSIHAHMCICNA